MKPRVGDDIVQIPVTFDTKGMGRLLTSGRVLWVFLIFIFWIFTSIVALTTASTLWKIMYPILSFVVLSTLARYLVLREKYFMSKRQELIDNDFKFDYSIFWNIYAFNDLYPYFVQFNNGLKGIFIMFDKDVIVGRPPNNDYAHHEAIANAYQQMSKRGIECVHIDYMDTVGKDTRMEGLFQNATNTENQDLRNVLTRIYDHIEFTMNRDFASYDVYCFYFAGREELFWDELKVVLGYFSQANYLRHRVLNKDDIGELVKSIMNIDDFSVNKACESLFVDSMTTEFLRPIWVERDGERKILAKTLDEVAEIKRVAQAEKKLKKSKKVKGKKFGRKEEQQEDINLFD